jgi:hypothetical protein|tara:strand:- start:1142 stop:1312 length:171 start_codon:yes stop_codon:yes gene_type:complete
MMLFQGSTRFTESITAKKYPQDAEYQKVTYVVVPLPSFRDEKNVKFNKAEEAEGLK